MGLWTRKSIEKLIVESEGSTARLKRTLGPWNLILLGIGVIIGAGLFSITGIAAAENAGPAITLAFLVAAVGCMFAGLCYSELASMIPISGSAYTYTAVTMGEFFAWTIGWTLILEYAIGAAAVSISWSAYLVSLLHDFNITLPVDLIASNWHPVKLPDGTFDYGLVNLPALFVIMATTMILIRGIKESAIVNLIMVTLKLSVVFLFIGIGIQHINYENYVPFIPENTGTFGEYGWSGIFRAAGIVFFAYIGFDAVSTAAQETVNPQKNMPIGILGSLIICTVIYILFAFVMTGLVNYKELNVAAPVALAIDKTPYLWLNWLIKLAILCGFTSVILVLLLGQSRIFYAMSRDGLLPKFFSELHPKYHTPWRSNIALMIFAGLFGAFAPLSVVGNMTSIGTLFAFVIVCAGVLLLRYTHPEYPRKFKTPFVPAVPILGILICTLMMLSLNLETWMRLIIWICVGIVIYFGYSRTHSVNRNKL